MSMFNSTLEELLNVLKNSIHGPFVAPIIQFLKSNQSAASTVDMVTKLFGSLESCIRAGDTYQLLSFKKKKKWSGFHAARFDSYIEGMEGFHPKANVSRS